MNFIDHPEQNGEQWPGKALSHKWCPGPGRDPSEPGNMLFPTGESFPDFIRRCYRWLGKYTEWETPAKLYMHNWLLSKWSSDDPYLDWVLFGFYAMKKNSQGKFAIIEGPTDEWKDLAHHLRDDDDSVIIVTPEINWVVVDRKNPTEPTV